MMFGYLTQRRLIKNRVPNISYILFRAAPRRWIFQSLFKHNTLCPWLAGSRCEALSQLFPLQGDDERLEQQICFWGITVLLETVMW